MQEHKYSINRPENLEFIKELRALVDNCISQINNIIAIENINIPKPKKFKAKS